MREDLNDLFNKDNDLQGEVIVFELAHMALNGKSISHVINTAAKLLGNALILVDSRQKVLAYSTIYEITDPLWAQNIERGCCSYEFVQKVRESRDMKEWSKQGSETQIITLHGDLQPKLVARITQEGHVVGAVIMIEHHTTIGLSHLQQLPLVGRLLFDVFNRDSSSVGVYGSFYSTILYSLLDEMEILDTLEHITMLKMDLPAEMRIVVARFVSHMENRYLKRTFSMELERIFPKGHCVYYKSYIGILVPLISEIQREELAKLAQCQGVSIGLSWPFTDIVEFKRHFNQAVTSIKIAQRFGRLNQVFDYSDFYYYDLLYNYTGKIPL
jgi:PucR family transcriptional regulator, proline-responsive transcriptional activator